MSSAPAIGLWTPLLAAAAAVGCGGEVDGPPGAAAGGGGAGGAAGACEESGELFAFELATPDGAVHDCANFFEDELTVQGAVVSAVAPTAWQIDACAPGAGCAPSYHTLTVLTSGLTLDIPAGTFVEISLAIKNIAGHCSAGLLVTNLPAFGGAANPASSDSAPWLDSSGPGSPFAREAVFRCATALGASGCPGEQELYDLTFSVAADPSTATPPVASGQSVDWEVPGGPAQGLYTARNLHAHSGYCEQPGSIEYFIARRTP